MLTAGQISKELKGELIGNSDQIIDSVSKIDMGQKNSISFLSNPKYEHHLKSTEASVILVSKTQILPELNFKTFIKVDDPYTSFCIILGKYFNPQTHPQGISTQASIGENTNTDETMYIGEYSSFGKNVKLGKNIKIYPNVFIGNNCQIGENTILYAGVKVYENCKIGNNCIIHCGTVIGSDGFGFARQNDGVYIKIPQIGNVEIEDNVEIGANATIDKATMGSTIIRQGVKLDNMVHIAHNVEIGKNTVIAAQTGISGSVKIDEGCVVGGQVGFVGHIYIAKGTQIGAQSGISKSITEENTKWIGSPAIHLKDAFKSQVIFKKLPEMDKKLNELEKKFREK
ncbi:MAG: UDP-3-O-(3-hydroxymyristoyl)glucosamine N-acyltransferase [Bacteroidetes bacterium]|nr:UDP-3-O-(3-hydroxymyristoyl)glucosamine N-acyltransferase [Bacteroidota bacterium]